MNSLVCLLQRCTEVSWVTDQWVHAHSCIGWLPLGQLLVTGMSEPGTEKGADVGKLEAFQQQEHRSKVGGYCGEERGRIKVP